MELQLGLALPTSSNPHDHQLDLNSSSSSDSTTTTFNHKKRSFSQLYYFVDDNNNKEKEKEVITAVPMTTLPLLPLTPNHDIIITQHPSNCSSTTLVTKSSDENDDDVELGTAVGWPPVHCWRKRLGYDDIDQTRVWTIHHGSTAVGCRVRGSNNNNKRVQYVKVKMEGVGIARKVDLTLHHSFHTLNQTLFHMFGKCHRRFSKCYQLAYQDHEGDWLLAQDVPWRSFIQCAQRLKLLKSTHR